MKLTHLIPMLLLAAILCVPVSAGVWHNGNYLTDEQYAKITAGDVVVVNAASGVTSKYRDMNPANEIKSSLNGNGGIAVGSIRAGYSTLSHTITVRNVLQDQNVSGMTVEAQPDATLRIPAEGDGVLAPGNYTATLDNFDLPDETAFFTIAVNQQEPTRISFIGQAASQPSVCKPVYTIKSALYGIGHTTCTPFTQHHGDYDRVWVDGYWTGSGHGRHYVEGHWEYQYVGHNNGDYNKHGSHYDYAEPTTGQNCVIDGTVIDVKSNVQQAVNSGATSLMFFNNARNPGGIFNAADVLVSQIQDPAVGYVKDVQIAYTNGCGLDKTIITKEYCNIDLQAGSAICQNS